MKKFSLIALFIFIVMTGATFANEDSYGYIGDTNAAGDADILRPEFKNTDDYATYLPNSKFINYAKQNFQKPVKAAGFPAIEAFYVKSHEGYRYQAASWQQPDKVNGNLIAITKKLADGTRYMFNCKVAFISQPGSTSFKVYSQDSSIDVENKHVIAADGTDLTQKAIMDQQAVEQQQIDAQQQQNQPAADGKYYNK
ncbi:MAG: hypothetical protein WC863_04720 [Patescibacteria group bacterium]